MKRNSPHTAEAMCLGSPLTLPRSYRLPPQSWRTLDPKRPREENHTAIPAPTTPPPLSSPPVVPPPRLSGAARQVDREMVEMYNLLTSHLWDCLCARTQITTKTRRRQMFFHNCKGTSQVKLCAARLLRPGIGCCFIAPPPPFSLSLSVKFLFFPSRSFSHAFPLSRYIHTAVIYIIGVGLIRLVGGEHCAVFEG